MSKSAPELEELVQRLVRDCGDPVQVLELYHWSQQPGMRDAIRALAALPEQPRATIQTYLAMLQDPTSVGVAINPSGELTVYSSEVAANLDAFRKATK